MTNHELETRLARAMERSAPNDLDGVLSRCQARKGTVIPMKKTTNRTWKSLIAACLTLVVLLGGGGGWFYQQSRAVASVVSLDVNPSIELTVNKNEKVLSCEGLNEEAREVLADYAGGADLKNVKLKVAVNALVASMLNRGYLEDVSSAILISVEDRDQTRAARLQQELAASVDVTLQEASSQAAILSQTVDQLPELETQARANQLSIGKAYLIRRIMEKNDWLALNSDTILEQLSALSVEELKDLAERKDVPGLPVDKSAVAADVLKYAGLDGVAPVGWIVDPELDEQPARYEVEIHYNGEEYEYIVDAFTGEILRGPRDVGKAQPSKPVEKPTEQISEAKAFDIAAADFYEKHPELSGHDLFHNKTRLDRDDGRLEYEVEFFINGFEVDYTIDAATGAILEWDTDYEGPPPQAVQPVKPEKPTQPEAPAVSDIGSDAAKAAALAHAGLAESQVSRLKAEADWDDGRLEYEVEFRADGMEYEYTIDGATGAILEHERDRDD